MQQRKLVSCCWQIVLVILTVLAAGAISAGSKMIFHKLQGFIALLLGFAMPFIVYRVLNRATWWAHGIVAAAVMIGGICAGIFYAQACSFLLHHDSLRGLGWVASRCTQGMINATYFGGICYPLLPAGFVCIAVAVANREKEPRK